MGEFKGTKGKWSVSHKVYKNEHGASYLEVDCIENGSGVTGLALVYEGITEHGLREMHANALLISKAPEMLEQLKELFELLEQHTPDWYSMGRYKVIKQLIKEATEV